MQEQNPISWCKKCHIVLGRAKKNVDVKDLFHRCGGAGSPMQIGDIENIPEKKISHIGTPCQGGDRHSDCIKQDCWCSCHKQHAVIPPPAKASGSLTVA